MAYTQEKNINTEPEKKVINKKTVNCGGKAVSCYDESTDECCVKNREQETGVAGAVNLVVNVGSNNADHYVNDMPYNYNVESPVIQPHVVQPHVITPINQNPYVIEPTIVNPTMVQPMVQQPAVYENNFDITRNYEGRIIQDDKGNYYIMPDNEVPIVPQPSVNPLPVVVEQPKQTNSVVPNNANSTPKKSKFNVLEMFGLQKSETPCIETFYPEFP